MMIKSFPVLFFPYPLRIRKYNRSSPTDKFCETGVLQKLVKIYRRTSVLESLLNEVASFQACNFIKE